MPVRGSRKQSGKDRANQERSVKNGVKTAQEAEQRQSVKRNTGKKEHRRREMSGKREDYISWDEYFMGVAILAARRSKDPSTQVG